VIAGTDEKLQKAKELHATYTINYKKDKWSFFSFHQMEQCSSNNKTIKTASSKK